MKVKEITVSNYKKFIEPKTISFCDSEGNVNDMNLLLGENGSGKSSILQAIVAAIAPLTRPGFKAQDLDWNGFVYRLIQSGRMPLKIDVEVDLCLEEIKATQKLFDKLKAMDNKNRFTIRPSDKENILLSFDYYKCRTVAKGSGNELFQLYGYQYAKQLSQLESNVKGLFDNVGSIFWYTENRNSFTLNLPFLDSKESIERENSLDGVRSFLATSYYFHIDVKRQNRTLKEGQFDFYENLERIFRKVFPNRHFVGPAPRFDVFEQSQAPDFFLSDGQNQYEISEMSAGERAIFPILMDFARYNINHSIIIIDEVELHLHSPLQQGLIRALPSLGVDNQFILTSHSDNVVVMFHDDEIIRL